MTPDEFRQLLADTPLDAHLLGPCLRDAVTPFVFDPNPAAWDAFRDEMSASLGFNRADMAVVGSGRFGFSLRPGRNLSPFRDNSDIDVVVVNADLFDELWQNLLRAAYPRRVPTGPLGGWLRDRQKEVYTGFLTPLEVRLDRRIWGARVNPVLEFRGRWFTTFTRVSNHVVRRHEGVKGRLYRTWTHAELYHLDSLRSLRTALAA